MTAIAPHITTFLRERLPVQRGASVHTCDSYAYAFQLLFRFISQQLKLKPSELQLEQIDAPLVMAFLDQLETERGNSASTRNVRLAAIKSFMRFCEYRVPSILEQSRRILAIPLKRTDQPLIKHLAIDESKYSANPLAPWAGLKKVRDTRKGLVYKVGCERDCTATTGFSQAADCVQGGWHTVLASDRVADPAGAYPAQVGRALLEEPTCTGA